MKKRASVAATRGMCALSSLPLAPSLPCAAGRAQTQNVAGQTSRYKPGDKIEYRVSKDPDVWEEGVFVRPTPDGTQPIIRKKPNEFYKEGFETAFQWDNIRPLTARPRTPPTAKPARPVPPPMSGRGLMTQAEILQFLRTRLGADPWGNPERPQILAELVVAIKQRGLNFHYSTLSDFGREISKYGLTSEVTFPLQDNYGPPTRLNWLMGAWNLSKISPATEYRKSDRVYRRGESGVNNVGVLTLNANGGYVWEFYGEVRRGRWRKATSQEMKSQGGDGVVLLKAKAGWDWIVLQDRVTELKGDWLTVSELESRQIREFGLRRAGR